MGKKFKAKCKVKQNGYVALEKKMDKARNGKIWVNVKHILNL